MKIIGKYLLREVYFFITGIAPLMAYIEITKFHTKALERLDNYFFKSTVSNAFENKGQSNYLLKFLTRNKIIYISTC